MVSGFEQQKQPLSLNSQCVEPSPADELTVSRFWSPGESGTSTTPKKPLSINEIAVYEAEIKRLRAMLADYMDRPGDARTLKRSKSSDGDSRRESPHSDSSPSRTIGVGDGPSPSEGSADVLRLSGGSPEFWCLKAKSRVSEERLSEDSASTALPYIHNIASPAVLANVVTDRELESLGKFWHRASWLVGLLIVQSTSSFILRSFEDLIKGHPVVVYFLTMLIGAGGNVGSQSTVLAIRGLCLGTITSTTRVKFVIEQLKTGAGLACILFVATFFRVYLFDSDFMDVCAVCLSMGVIVLTSVMIGSTMPLGLRACGIDPAHAGAAIQVTMDIIGVTITCVIGWVLLAKLGMRESKT